MLELRLEEARPSEAAVQTRHKQWNVGGATEARNDGQADLNLVSVYIMKTRNQTV